MDKIENLWVVVFSGPVIDAGFAVLRVIGSPVVMDGNIAGLRFMRMPMVTVLSGKAPGATTFDNASDSTSKALDL